MISGIFIARPRLAVVISVVITLAGAIAMTQIPIAQFPDIVPPQIAVTANYAGASAEVVEATVAQPIESRVIGVDRMLYMKSTSGNDGSYTLTVTFAVGTDPDLNTVNTQNRVGLAEPQLPMEVRSQGISVTKKSSALLQIVTMTSPDGRYDQLFLANYATINVIDSLKRVPGVGDVSMFDAGRLRMRSGSTPIADKARPDPSDIAMRSGAERPGRGRPHRRAAGDCPTSSSSSRSRPRAGCRASMSSAASCCAPIPTGRSCGFAMWRASSSGRRRWMSQAG